MLFGGSCKVGKMGVLYNMSGGGAQRGCEDDRRCPLLMSLASAPFPA